MLFLTIVWGGGEGGGEGELHQEDLLNGNSFFRYGEGSKKCLNNFVEDCRFKRYFSCILLTMICG